MAVSKNLEERVPAKFAGMIIEHETSSSVLVSAVLDIGPIIQNSPAQRLRYQRQCVQRKPGVAIGVQAAVGNAMPPTSVCFGRP